MKRDRNKYFIDFVGAGKRLRLVRGVVRWGQTYYCGKDFCAAAWINYPKSFKAKLQPNEYTRANIDGRSMIVASIEGLIGLIPNRPEFWIARKHAAELIRSGALRIESEELQDEQQ